MTDTAPALIRRLRVTAAAVALVALAFSQAPGRLIGDTKSDLVLDPGGFLRRAVEAWDPSQDFGQVANQSYGYLWPMGPFFWLGHAAGLPGWVVQRGWWALLLVVGFTGALRLAERLRIGSPATQLVAALAYALSPRVLSVLGTISVQAWPAAVLPWVLIPLVRGAAGELTPRRAAAWSGVAVLCLGGVNAAATAAVLPLPLLYLLTRPTGVRGRLLTWWLPITVLASAWWALPLLVLGRYGYPFLDLIESAKATTSVTGLTDTLRGGSHWLGYLVVDGRPVWTAGWQLATSSGLVLATVLIAAAGLAGLLLPGLAERRWLVGAVLLGTALVTAAHTGELTGPLAPSLQAALDGGLAPLRNVHKADPVLRLPLALGLAHLLAVVARSRWAPSRWPSRWRPALAGTPVAAGLLLVTLLPAWGGGLAPEGAYKQTPGYWQQAADWLGQHSGGERAVLLPSANAPVYRWGTPRDEPLQALASSPWAVRNGAPLGPPGSTRLLDALDARLATGQPSAAYAEVLARAGVRYVVLRNDLDPDRSGSERPAVVRAALASSPGLREVATFGPAQGSAFRSGDRLAGARTIAPPAIELFEVPGAQRVTAFPDDGAVALSGGPEGVLPLADAGLLAGRAVMGTIDADAVDEAEADSAADNPFGIEAGTESDDDAIVQTDTMRRRAYNAGADPGRRYSATLTAGEPVPRPDIGPYDAGQQAVAVLEGASSVRASSSADDPFADDAHGAGYLGPDRRPTAAVDGDPSTAWVSSAGTVGQYFELRLVRPMQPASATVSLLTDPGLGPAVTDLDVTTDAGTVPARVTDGTAVVTLPAGSTSRIRVTVTGVAGDASTGAVGIRELTVPGVEVTEAIALPPEETTTEQWTVLAERPDGRRGDCVQGEAGWTCAPGLARAGEETGPLQRRFEAPAGSVTVAGTVRPRPGTALDTLLDDALGYRATGSSQLVADPVARPGAAYDGDRSTAWLPAAADQAPRLTLALGRTVTLRGLADLDWTGVAAVDLSTPDGQHRTLTGPGSFSPLRTEQVTLTFRRQVGAPGAVPAVAVRELTLVGAPARSSGVVQVDCGAGPAVTLDGRDRRLGIRASVADLLTLAPVPATVCGPPVEIAGGPHRMSSAGTSVLAVATAALRSGRVPAAPAARAIGVSQWSDQRRVIDVAAGAQGYLALAEGYNDGWHATIDGQRLIPVRLDGWRQAWKLPAGGATQVTITYGPGSTQHYLLLAGLIAAVLVLGLALLPGRREAPMRIDPLPATPGRWWRAIPVVLAGALLVGPIGLAAAAAALLLPRRWWAVSAGGVLGLAGVLLAVDPGAAWIPGTNQGLAAAALCVLTAALAEWRPPGEPLGEPERRPLDQRPRQPAEHEGDERGQHRDRQHAAAEVGPAGDPVDRVEHGQVPEEHSVGPPPQHP